MEQDFGTAVRKWTDGTFSPRSGFYAGRPPSNGDLGSKHLEMLYQGIKEDIGTEAAGNFVRFVNKLDDLCASSFIVAFEEFWYGDCGRIGVEQNKSDRVQLSGRGDELMGEGFGAIGSMLGSNMNEEDYFRLSQGVKADFIRTHLDEIPEEERREVVCSMLY